MATSATMSAAVINDIKKVLHLREENLFISQCSVDRPNFAILAHPIINPIHSYCDLSFVLNDWEPGKPPPPKFIIFFDNIRSSVDASNYLRGLLPRDQCYHVKWFNSDMSDEFKWRETERFACGETWGLLATDSFGMVRGALHSNQSLMLYSRAWLCLISSWLYNGVLRHQYLRYGSSLDTVPVTCLFMGLWSFLQRGSTSTIWGMQRRNVNALCISKWNRVPNEQS